MSRPRDDWPFCKLHAGLDTALALAGLSKAEGVLMRYARRESYQRAAVRGLADPLPFRLNLSMLARRIGWERKTLDRARANLIETRLWLPAEGGRYTINKDFRSWTGNHALTDPEAAEAEAEGDPAAIRDVDYCASEVTRVETDARRNGRASVSTQEARRNGRAGRVTSDAGGASEVTRPGAAPYKARVRVPEDSEDLKTKQTATADDASLRQGRQDAPGAAPGPRDAPTPAPAPATAPRAARRAKGHPDAPGLVDLARGLSDRFGSGAYADAGADRLIADAGGDLAIARQAVRDVAGAIGAGRRVDSAWGLASHAAKEYRKGKPLPTTAPAVPARYPEPFVLSDEDRAWQDRQYAWMKADAERRREERRQRGGVAAIEGVARIGDVIRKAVPTRAN